MSDRAPLTTLCLSIVNIQGLLKNLTLYSRNGEKRGQAAAKDALPVPVFRSNTQPVKRHNLECGDGSGCHPAYLSEWQQVGISHKKRVIWNARFIACFLMKATFRAGQPRPYIGINAAPTKQFAYVIKRSDSPVLQRILLLQSSD